MRTRTRSSPKALRQDPTRSPRTSHYTTAREPANWGGAARESPARQVEASGAGALRPWSLDGEQSRHMPPEGSSLDLAPDAAWTPVVAATPTEEPAWAKLEEKDSASRNSPRPPAGMGEDDAQLHRPLASTAGREEEAEARHPPCTILPHRHDRPRKTPKLHHPRRRPGPRPFIWRCRQQERQLNWLRPSELAGEQLQLRPDPDLGQRSEIFSAQDAQNAVQGPQKPTKGNLIYSGAAPPPPPAGITTGGARVWPGQAWERERVQ
jgi:hypothetical protein